MWLVQDGGERELAVGEDWTIDPMFNADAPMQPAEDDSVFEMTPESMPDSLTAYRITARVHRLEASSGVALEVPGLLVGYYTEPPFPDGRPPFPDSGVVTGRGTIDTDCSGVRSMSEAFPELKRSCIIEAITLITAPMIAAPESAPEVPLWPRQTHVPDWTRRRDFSVQRMRRWEDERPGRLTRYFVTVRLTDEMTMRPNSPERATGVSRDCALRDDVTTPIAERPADLAIPVLEPWQTWQGPM